MRPKSNKPKKQRQYEHNIPMHEAHKILSAPLSKKLKEEKGFRSLPIREGDTVLVVRGDHKGHSGKVNSTDPQRRSIFVDGIVNQKTDNTEIPVPIHPSNVIIEKYARRDRRRLEMINRRIKDEEQKLDIDSVLEEARVEEETDLIEFEDDEFEDFDEIDEIDDDILLDEDEFELIDEEEEIDEENDIEEVESSEEKKEEN